MTGPFGGVGPGRGFDHRSSDLITLPWTNDPLVVDRMPSFPQRFQSDPQTHCPADLADPADAGRGSHTPSAPRCTPHAPHMRRLLVRALAAAVVALVAAALPVAADHDFQDTGHLLPEPTHDAAAVWTGDEVLVFPPFGEPVMRYDPATGQSSQSATYFFSLEMSAIWDGQHAYLFGDDAIRRYDPVQDHVQDLGIDPQYFRGSAVWTGEHAYLFGGLQAGVETDKIFRFTPATGEYVALDATLPSPRYDTAAVWDGQYAYIIAGVGGGWTLGEVLRFDPATGVVETIIDDIGSNTGIKSAVWNGHAIYVFGIDEFTFNGVDDFYSHTMPLRIDVQSGEVARRDTEVKIPDRRSDAAAVYDPETQTAYVLGGWATYPVDVEPGHERPEDDIYRYDLAPHAPEAVPYMHATTVEALGQIEVGWHKPQSDGGLPLTYTIERSSSASGPFAEVATLAPGEWDEEIPGLLTWIDTGLADGTQYHYRVYPTNDEGSGPASSPDDAYTIRLPSYAPLNPWASGGPDRGQITFTWRAVSDECCWSTGARPITHYTVYASDSAAGPFSQVAQVQAGTTEWTETGLADGQQRHYQVAAAHLGEGPRSATATGKAFYPPTAPRDLATTRGPDAGEISLTWLSPLDGGGAALTYQVYRSPDEGGPFTPLADVGATWSWIDTGLTEGAEWYYTVVAKNVVGAGPMSNVAFGKAPERPTAPEEVAAATGPGSVLAPSAEPLSPGTIQITWSPPADSGGIPIESYRLFRSTAVGGPEVDIDPGMAGEYVDEDLVPGMRYYYRLTATNDVGEGPSSNTTSARASLWGAGGPVPDGDGDLVPDLLEAALCGTPLSSSLINDGSVLGTPVHDPDGALGACDGADAYAGPHEILLDQDGDLVADDAEPTLCQVMNPLWSWLGSCVGGTDYAPPPDAVGRWPDAITG